MSEKKIITLQNLENYTTYMMDYVGNHFISSDSNHTTYYYFTFVNGMSIGGGSSSRSEWTFGNNVTASDISLGDLVIGKDNSNLISISDTSIRTGLDLIPYPDTYLGSSTNAFKNLYLTSGSNNVALLDNSGKLNSSILPAIAVSETFTASSQSAMLALTAQVGDVCVRTDETKTYILVNTPASTIGNWKLLEHPADAVTSVNGQTGLVSLTASDVGALPSTTTIPTKTSQLTNDSDFITSADIPSAVTSIDGLSGGTINGSTTISGDLTVSGTNGDITARYVTGTWLKSTSATDTSSWTDVWVNNSGWLYKRSKSGFKSDLGVQDTLVSGTNIKTINGNSILGSGDLTISGGSAEVVDSSPTLNLSTETGGTYNLPTTKTYTVGTVGGDSLTVKMPHVNNVATSLVNNGGLKEKLGLDNFEITDNMTTTSAYFTKSFKVNSVYILLPNRGYSGKFKWRYSGTEYTFYGYAVVLMPKAPTSGTVTATLVRRNSLSSASWDQISSNSDWKISSSTSSQTCYCMNCNIIKVGTYENALTLLG